MFTMAALVLFGVVIGLAVLVKVIFALLLIPFKIGFGLLKLAVFVIIGIPLLVLGVAATAVAVPVLIMGFPLLCIAALIAAPFAIAKRW